MNIKSCRKLRKLAPTAYGTVEFEIEDGWYKLLAKLGPKLETIDGLKAVQIKEKFGGLRVYLNFMNEKIQDEIDEIEQASIKICEYCGKPGELLDRNGWLKTLCDDCKLH